MTDAYYVLVYSNTSHTSLMLSLNKWSNWQKRKGGGMGRGEGMGVGGAGIVEFFNLSHAFRI